MKKSLLFIALLACTLSAQAQLETWGDETTGIIKYPALIADYARDGDGNHEIIGVRGEYITKNVLIKKFQFTYTSTGEDCIESIVFRIQRDKPTEIVGGLITHEEKGWSTVEDVEVRFVPTDDKWVHWSGSLIANPNHKHEVVQITTLRVNTVKKKDYHMELISSDK
ncbi:MAG: hypothetical protein J6M53_04850 [Bacteroidaceae bacterium]|nr:hypothetical protein [Bacteroidaceae bacterium]